MGAQSSGAPWEEGAERRHKGLMGHLMGFAEHLSEVRRVLEQHAPRAPLAKATSIAGNTPYQVAKLGYRYLRIHSTASAVLTVNTGAGIVQLGLMQGWNNLDFPEGSRITASPAVNVTVELTDYTPPPA